MKKIVALLICVLLIAALAIPAFAADSDSVITVSVDKTTAKVGDEIVLTFTMSGSNKFKAGSIDLVFDRSVFEVVTDGDGLPAFTGAQAFPWMIMPNESVTKLVIAKMSGAAASIDGVLGTLTLRVIGECPSTEILTGANGYATPTNSEGNFPITVNGTSITITGEHTYGEWAPHTPYEHIRTCEKCNAQQTAEHNWVKGDVIQQPNCTTEGKQNATCSDCQLEQVITLPTNDEHEMGDWMIEEPYVCGEERTEFRYCVNCYNPMEGTGYIEKRSAPAVDHKYGEWYIVTDSTCESEGVERRDCQYGLVGYDCDHYETRTIEKKEHKLPEEWSLAIPATCTEEGMEHRCCETCWNPVMATGYRETRPIPALGHSYGEWYVATEATCEENGEMRRDCTYVGYGPDAECDHYEAKTIPATGHTMTDWYVFIEPGCETSGEKRRHCEVCWNGVSGEMESATIPAIGHTMTDWYVFIEPGCETSGEKRRHCEVCWNGVSGEMENTTIPALGHDYKSEVTTPATCKDEGVLTYTCQNDETHTYTESIPKTTTHTPSDETVEIKAPTCTEQGISSGKCAICGVNMNEFKTDALGHDMGEWYVYQDSTCTAEGEMRSDCSRCDHYDSKVIEKKEHSYESVVTAPTCTKNGFTTHTCSVCGNNYQTPGDKALGHEFVEYTQTKAPTCTKDGEETAKCTRCDVTDTQKIPANGHDYVGTKVEPTCTKPGKESGQCAVCGDEVNEKEIPALGHDFAEYKQTKAPTCTEKGEETADCSRCDATDVKEIAALGHTYGDWIKVDGETHKHVCQVETCGHEEVVKHNWDTGKVTVEPTHTEPGVKTYECKDCHATREEEVAKTTKHEYDAKAEQIVDEEGNVDEKYHTGICACGEQHKEKHSYDILGDVIKEPTATTKGEQEVFCACGHKTIRKLNADGTLDPEPGMGDITGQVVMTGIAAFSMIAAAAYVFIRKRTA